MTDKAFDKNLKVLVIEDSAITVKIFRNFLNRLEIINVYWAECGSDAIKIVAEEKLDLIIADINIPEPNGLKVLEYIRNNESTKCIPVLITTGESRENFIVYAMRHGANAYLVKPFTIEQLSEKLNKILN
jgi:two-component system chemotaxis response regulator CheY